MLTQRAGMLLKRGPAGALGNRLPKFPVSTSLTLSRPVTTSKISNTDASALLAAQRLKRPISPHLQIYKLDQTWFGASAWTRITGTILSGSLYLYATGYLVAPLLGWHLESASVAAAFGALPFVVKGGIKFLLSWPFVFHSVNGVRHLVNDLGKGFAKSQIKSLGWGIWGVSLLGGLYLGFLY